MFISPWMHFVLLLHSLLHWEEEVGTKLRPILVCNSLSDITLTTSLSNRCTEYWVLTNYDVFTKFTVQRKANSTIKFAALSNQILTVESISMKNSDILLTKFVPTGKLQRKERCILHGLKVYVWPIFFPFIVLSLKILFEDKFVEHLLI